jgi:PAS domain S-box-containing protein
LKETYKKLQESELMLRAIFDNSIDAISVSISGFHFFVNKAYLELFGYQSNEELFGKPVLDLIADSQREKITEYIGKRANNEYVPSSYETIGLKKDRTEFVLDVRVSPMNLSDEIYTLVILRDITQNKIMEKALYNEKIRAEQYLNIAEVIMVALDNNGEIQLINKKGHAVLGYLEGELIGKNWFEFCLPKEEYEEVFSVYKKIIDGEIENFEYYENYIICKDCTKKCIAWHNSLLKSESGEIIGTLSSGVDITERKAVIEALQLSEAKFRQTFDLSPVGAAIVGLDKRFQRVNKAFANFLKYDSDELSGMSIDEITFPEDSNLGMADMNLIVKGEIEATKLEKRYMTKNNEIVWGEITISLVRDSNNNPLYFLPIIQDITERKESEQKLQKLNDELEQKVIERTEELNKVMLFLENTNIELRDLNNAIAKESTELVKLNDRLAESEQQLKTANDTKDKFFSIIAHDLKNPLQGLIFSSGLLVKNIDAFDKEKIRRKAVQFNKTSLELSELLENLLNWSRSQSGRIIFQPELINLKDIITNTLDLFNESILLKELTIEFDPSGDLFIKADKNLIDTVIRNLISNAVNFTGINGKVSINVDENEENIVFSVKDTGIGLSKNDMDSLFNIDVSSKYIGTSSEKGTGLGLIICREFVEKHGGKIWVESEIGKGSKFSFSVPK